MMNVAKQDVDAKEFKEHHGSNGRQEGWNCWEPKHLAEVLDQVVN